MTPETILAEVNGIFRQVLDEEDMVLRESTTADEIEGWDSLTNVELMVYIEKHFRIRFNSGEIMGFKNVGDLCRNIQSKLARA